MRWCAWLRRRITMVNAQAERLFGYQREELEVSWSKSWFPAPPTRCIRSTGRPIWLIQAPAMGGGMQLSVCRRDGSIFPATFPGGHRHRGGILMTAAVRDVTAGSRRKRNLSGLTGSWNRSPIGLP